MAEQKTLSAVIVGRWKLSRAGHINPVLALAEELMSAAIRLRFTVSPQA